jgi:IclR family transcriptional regulator, pca regulon regulatory protein
MTFVQYANNATRKRKATDMLGSFAKGLAVIEAFSSERQRLSITDVAAATGLDRATARRCLLTLAELGYADFDSKYFRLTPRILRLGTACLATMALPHIVQPFLDQLSSEIGQSTSVSILDDWEIVYVARAAERRLMSIRLMPGSRLPAICTSMGRVMLATLPGAQIEDILSRHPPVKRTPFSITNTAELMRILAEAKQYGFTINNQELEVGLRSIGVPIYDSHGHVVAALNTGVAAVHEDAIELRDLYLPKLLAVQSALRPLLV